jgi:hypothetical protein
LLSVFLSHVARPQSQQSILFARKTSNYAFALSPFDVGTAQSSVLEKLSFAFSYKLATFNYILTGNYKAVKTFSCILTLLSGFSTSQRVVCYETKAVSMQISSIEKRRR